MKDLRLVETAARTIELLTDAQSFEVARDELVSRNPLAWPNYSHTLEAARQRASGDESVIAGSATIDGTDIEMAVFDFAFIAGSMGEVAGERLARALERAARRSVPFVLVTSSGGARMQEGMISLVQMPKLAVARLHLAEAHQPLIAVLEDPTTGGVLASVAGLADVTAAVEGATIGFAGPRVVQRFTGALPQSSHTAATAFESGLVDALIGPDDRHSWLRAVVGMVGPNAPDSSAAQRPESAPSDTAGVHPAGPDLLIAASEGTIELRGDRAGADDRAVVTAIARLGGHRVVVLALDHRLSPGPSAYRKARRVLGIAARLDLPVLTIIDSHGADPSPTSESSGIAWAIAELIEAMLSAPVPIIAVVTGEGGSGGALALATGDVLLAYESSVFSVIAPEAAAEILWRDGGRAAEAAELLKLGARDLLEFGIADALISDPVEPGSLVDAVTYHLGLLADADRTSETRVRDRRRRWRGIAN
jgi:acetyl-CoA carboxylase carboxyl transferase beta subunit